MKKIISEVIQVVIAYVFGTIYLYYNGSEPLNKYCWLASAILVSILYLIIKLTTKKDKLSA